MTFRKNHLFYFNNIKLKNNSLAIFSKLAYVIALLYFLKNKYKKIQLLFEIFTSKIQGRQIFYESKDFQVNK